MNFSSLAGGKGKLNNIDPAKQSFNKSLALLEKNITCANYLPGVVFPTCMCVLLKGLSKISFAITSYGPVVNC